MLLICYLSRYAQRSIDARNQLMTKTEPSNAYYQDTIWPIGYAARNNLKPKTETANAARNNLNKAQNWDGNFPNWWSIRKTTITFTEDHLIASEC